MTKLTDTELKITIERRYDKIWEWSLEVAGYVKSGRTDKLQEILDTINWELGNKQLSEEDKK